MQERAARQDLECDKMSLERQVSDLRPYDTAEHLQGREQDVLDFRDRIGVYKHSLFLQVVWHNAVFLVDERNSVKPLAGLSIASFASSGTSRFA